MRSGAILGAAIGEGVASPQEQCEGDRERSCYTRPGETLPAPSLSGSLAQTSLGGRRRRQQQRIRCQRTRRAMPYCWSPPVKLSISHRTPRSPKPPRAVYCRQHRRGPVQRRLREAAAPLPRAAADASPPYRRPVALCGDADAERWRAHSCCGAPLSSSPLSIRSLAPSRYSAHPVLACCCPGLLPTSPRPAAPSRHTHSFPPTSFVDFIVGINAMRCFHNTTPRGPDAAAPAPSQSPHYYSAQSLGLLRTSTSRASSDPGSGTTL